MLGWFGEFLKVKQTLDFVLGMHNRHVFTQSSELFRWGYM